MTEEKKIPQKENVSDTQEKLKWEKKTKNKGILDLLQPIIGNFVLLVEEERKRTLEKLEQTKNALEKVKKN